MGTEEQLVREIASIHAELQRLRANVSRAQAKINGLESDESAIRQTAKRLGITLSTPDDQAIAQAAAKKRAGGRVRAIDASLQVGRCGETVFQRDVAERVVKAAIPFESSRPDHALGIAMRRSPQFEFLGRGRFRRQLFEIQREANEDSVDRSPLITESGGTR